MKTTTLLFRIAAALLTASFAYPAAWDLRMVQFDASNRSRDVVISPTANSLLGFAADKRIVNITPGTNIVISGNQISATGGGNVNKGTPFAATQLLYVSNATTGEITGIPGATYTPGNNTITFNGTMAANTLNISSLTGELAGAHGGTGVANTGKTITLAGNLTTSGAHNIILTSTGASNVTLPTTGTLATVGGNLSAATATTAAEDDNSTKVATTAYVQTELAGLSGASFFTGFTTAIPDAESVPTGWSLTGVNGIPPSTTPDADYKVIFKTGGSVAAVTANVAAGAVASGTQVLFETSTPSAAIRYTTNGTDPTRTSGTVVSGPVTITADTTFETIAYRDFWTDTSVQSWAYTVTGGGGPAFVAEVGAGAATGGDGFTTGEIATTGANLLIAVKVWYGGTEPALSDSKGNTYTAAGAAQPDNSGTRWIRQYYVYGGTVGANHSWTLDGTGHYAALGVLALSGMAASPVDQNAGDEEVSWTTHPSGSLTPGQANTVSVTGIMFDSGSGDITHPTGYTAAPEVMTSSGAHIGVSVAWKTLNATTTINPDWTAATSYLYGAAKHVTYKF